MWWRTLQLGIRNLLLHKLRSFLTMLGTILGVASVIAMLAISEGSKQAALRQIRELGATNVIIRSIKPEPKDDLGSSGGGQQDVSEVISYGLRYQDFDVLRETITSVQRALPIALVRKNAQHGPRRIANARILGTTPDLLHVKNLSVDRGRFISPTDIDGTANVVVLSAGAAQRLFSFQDPLGQPLLLGNSAYRVIGILREQGSGSATPGAASQDNFNYDLYVPLSAARKRFGELQMIVRAGSREFERTQLAEITLTVNNERYVSQTAAMATDLLRRSHADAEDFEVQVPLELLQRAEEEKRIWNLVLVSIAGISLLVGGIGIMNIMLATVTERTREIGIRRALGATRRDITAQFLAETMVLSCTGGLLGIGLGVAAPLAISMAFNMEVSIRVWSIALAFIIAAGTGVVFGLYPAVRAAMMDPIEALRHE